MANGHPGPSTATAGLGGPKPAPAHTETGQSKRDLRSWWKNFQRSDKAKPDDKGKRIFSSRDEVLSGTLGVESVALEADGRDLTGEEYGGAVECREIDSRTTAAPGESSVGCDSERRWFKRRHSIECTVRARTAPYVPTNIAPDIAPQGIFGVPLHTSIRYANVAISLFDEQGESYIYGYVPIVVAKCGVYLKEKGECDTV